MNVLLFQNLKDICAKMVVDMEVDYSSYCNDELTEWIDR